MSIFAQGKSHDLPIYVDREVSHDAMMYTTNIASMCVGNGVAYLYVGPTLSGFSHTTQQVQT